MIRIVVDGAIENIACRYLCDLAYGLTFPLQSLHFALKRRFQVVRGATEFGDRFSDRPPQFWKLFGPKQNEGYDEDDDHLLDTKCTHRRGALPGVIIAWGTLKAAALAELDLKADMFGDAEAYERFMGRWSRLVAPLLVDFANVPDSGRVLDAGSGTGSLAFALARSGKHAQVLGIDPSEQYVQFAHANNPFPERVVFQAGDAQHLHLPDRAFEASLSLLVFNFIPDRQGALQELCRVTKPGGRVSAAVWDYSSGMRMLRGFWDSAVSLDANAERLDEKHMPLCRAGELGQLWRQSGLANVHEQPLDITMQFNSFADYWDPFLLGQGPAGAYVRGIHRDRLQALRDEVKGRLSVTDEDAPFALPARAWAVSGSISE